MLNEHRISPDCPLLSIIEQLRPLNWSVSQQLNRAFVSYMRLIRSHNLVYIRQCISTEPNFYSVFQSRLTLSNITDNVLWDRVNPPSQSRFLASEASSMLCLKEVGNKAQHRTVQRIREELEAIQRASQVDAPDPRPVPSRVQLQIETAYKAERFNLEQDAISRVRWQLDWSQRHYAQRHGRHVIKELALSLKRCRQTAASCLHDLHYQPCHFYEAYDYEGLLHHTMRSWVSSWLEKCKDHQLADMNAWIKVSLTALTQRVPEEQKLMDLGDSKSHNLFIAANRRWYQSGLAATVQEALAQTQEMLYVCHRRFPNLVSSFPWLDEWVKTREDFKQLGTTLRAQQTEHDAFVRSRESVLNKWRTNLYQAALRADVIMFSVALLQNAKAYIMRRCLEEGVRPQLVNRDEEDEEDQDIPMARGATHVPQSSWMPGLERLFRQASSPERVADIELQHVQMVEKMEQALFRKCEQTWVREDLQAPFREVLQDLCEQLAGLQVGGLQQPVLGTHADTVSIPRVNSVLDSAPIPLRMHATWRTLCQELYVDTKKRHPTWAIDKMEWALEMKQVNESGGSLSPREPDYYWQRVNALVAVAMLCDLPATRSVRVGGVRIPSGR